MTNAAPLTHADGSPTRALVVDDEVMLAELLTMALRYDGWDVRSAGSGTEAVRAARDFAPDVVLLDVMLPDIDGLEVLRRLRAHDPDVPVLFLTARDAVEDRIAGITAGGDDYVTKPFSLEEVVARIRGLVRRRGAALLADDALLVVGDLSLDEDSHEVRRGGDPVELTATEFELLRYFMRNPKRVLSKAQILDRVWNYDFGGQANIVELYVSYLRKKIDAGRREVTVKGDHVQLAPKEFDLLWELLDHRGLVLTRDQLLERVWGYTFAGDTRTVDVHVRQLRRKLGDASPIVTVWGVGYKVAPAKDAVNA